MRYGDSDNENLPTVRQAMAAAHDGETGSVPKMQERILESAKGVRQMNGPNSYQLMQLAAELALKGEDGFDTDEQVAEWQAALDGYIALAENKFAACAAVVRRADADAGFLREEAKRFANAAAKLDAVAARVTERTLSLLQAHEAATGQSKVTFDGTAWVKIARRNSVQTIVETDVDLLDFKFQRITIAADKVKIKAALEAGEVVSGCSLLAVVSESVSFSK